MSDIEPNEHISWRDMVSQTADIVGDRTIAKWLCEHASGCELGEFSSIQDELVTHRSAVHLDAMMRRYLAGEPVQYVMGRWAFRHLDLMVDSRVLIPRPETELLPEIVKRHLATMKSPYVVSDLGTGSGAIGLSLLHELPVDSTTVWMTDASSDAIDVARANGVGIGRHATNARFAVGEWFAAFTDDLKKSFHAIVSNPPYIAEHDPELADSVNKWEPHKALFAGSDGLDDLRVIISESPQWLMAGGLLAVEMGYTQATAVAVLFGDAGFVNVIVHRDLAGKDRFVSGVLPN
jgi:release factor glutamine methyltransferase